MSATDLKTLFRKNLKVVAGGPAVGTPGSNRTQGLLNSLDALADEVGNGGTPTDAYTKAQTDVLLAVKQGTLTEAVHLTATAGTYALTRTVLGKYLILDSNGNSTVSLPPITLSDVGTVLLVRGGSGPGTAHALTLQGARGESFSVEGEGVINFLQVTKLDAGTPLGVGASWVLLAKTPVPLPTYDLLALTGAQMDEVMAFTYTNGDAPLAGTPAWSRPGHSFDAIYPNGSSYHFYAGRGNYTPGTAGSGVGPRWSRIPKL